MKRAILLSLADRHLDEVEAIIHADIARFLRTLSSQGKEVRLCVAQGNLHLAHLQNLMWVGWADTKAGSTIHDVLSKTHRQRDSSLLGLLVTDGVVVDASCHTTNDRIEAAVVLLAHDLLKDDGHLLLVNHIACGRHVVLAAAIEDAGVNALNRF